MKYIAGDLIVNPCPDWMCADQKLAVSSHSTTDKYFGTCSGQNERDQGVVCLSVRRGAGGRMRPSLPPALCRHLPQLPECHGPHSPIAFCSAGVHLPQPAWCRAEDGLAVGEGWRKFCFLMHKCLYLISYIYINMHNWMVDCMYKYVYLAFKCIHEYTW